MMQQELGLFELGVPEHCSRLRLKGEPCRPGDSVPPYLSLLLFVECVYELSLSLFYHVILLHMRGFSGTLRSMCDVRHQKNRTAAGISTIWTEMYLPLLSSYIELTVIIQPRCPRVILIDNVSGRPCSPLSTLTSPLV